MKSSRQQARTESRDPVCLRYVRPEIERRCRSAPVLGVGGHGVARLAQCLHDVIDSDVVVVEGHGQCVLVHVGLDGIHVLDLLDGRTGPRSGSASDHARRLEDIGDRLRSSGRDETEKEDQGKDESMHRSLR